MSEDRRQRRRLALPIRYQVIDEFRWWTRYGTYRQREGPGARTLDADSACSTFRVHTIAGIGMRAHLADEAGP